MPVINVRNHQRPAQVSADSLVPGRDLRRIRLRERIGTRVENGIAVFVIEARANAVDPLPQHALHAIKRRYALRRRAAPSWSAPASARTSKCNGRSALATWSASRQSRRACAARISRRSSAPKTAACASEAALACIARPLEKDADGREPAAPKSRVLVPLPNRAVHKNCVRRRRLPQWPRLAGSCTLRFLPGCSLLTFSAVLIVENHLLETAAPPAKALSARPRTSGARRSAALLCRAILAILAGASRASTARKLPAAQPAPAAPLSWRFRVVGGTSVCGSRIGWCHCSLRRFVWVCGRTHRSLDRRKRSNFQRHSNRAGSLAQIEFLRHVFEAELADLNSVMPERQSRQIEMAVLIGPTDPRPRGAGFDQAM